MDRSDLELQEIFDSFCEHMGLAGDTVGLDMLVDPEFYVAAFKHLFPTFDVPISSDESPTQQVIDILGTQILELDLGHIDGRKVEAGSKEDIKNLLALLTDIARVQSESSESGESDAQAFDFATEEEAESSEKFPTWPEITGDSIEISETSDSHTFSNRAKPKIPKLLIHDQEQASVPVSHNAAVKSSESVQSVGTVIQHETPKRESSKRSQQRPASAKVRHPTPKRGTRPPTSQLKEEISMITSLASNDIIKSIYSLVTTKNKALHVKEMDQHDQAEIQAFFQDQKRRFRQMLEEHVVQKRVSETLAQRRDRLRAVNRQKSERSAQLKESAQLDEIRRAQQSNVNQKELYELKVKKRIKTILQRHEKNRKLDKAQRRKEVSQAHQHEKDLILENIKNYYADKIAILKDQIGEEKKSRKILEREQRRVLSENRQTARTVRKRQLEEAKALISAEADKAQLDLIGSENFEADLLKLYRRHRA